MSLSVPYVLRAAVEVAPRLMLRLEEQLTVSGANELSAQSAQVLWCRGYRPGDPVAAVTPIDQLAAARLGLTITAAADPRSPQGPQVGAESEGCDLSLLESRTWSASRLYIEAGVHGEYLEQIRSPRHQLDPVLPLTRLMLPILTSLNGQGSSPHLDNCVRSCSPCS